MDMANAPRPPQNASGFVLTVLSKVTRRSTPCLTSASVRQVAPDRVLPFIGRDPSRLARHHDEDVAICASVQRGLRSRAYDAGRLSVRREAG